MMKSNALLGIIKLASNGHKEASLILAAFLDRLVTLRRADSPRARSEVDMFTRNVNHHLSCRQHRMALHEVG